MLHDARAAVVAEVLLAEFGELMAREPSAFRRKFRKMAASPFAFYRGSACLFYADVEASGDPYLNPQTSRVWMHGDLHAENFGTYMDSAGVLVFNVNDFDEAYVGPFTWDLKRFVASVALIGYAKALSDTTITDLVTGYVRAYIDEVRAICAGGHNAIGALTLDTTHGVLHEVLQRARLNTRIGLLTEQTTIDNYERRFTVRDGVYPVDPSTRERVESAFGLYLATLPPTRTNRPIQHRVKDVVLRHGMGIGSAGLPSYSLLLEGHSQALENDVIVYMKQGQVPAVSRVVDDPRVRSYFRHQGHRTYESQRALQAHADAWLGYTELDGVGQVVAEVSPYAEDLDWSDLNEPADLVQVIGYLGVATARMHSVADAQSAHDLVDVCTENVILAAIETDEAGFIRMLVDFAHAQGDQTRQDHQIFVDLFRNNRFPGL